MQLKRAAVVVACLLAGALPGEACHLSLVGTVAQQPLTYNPFQAGATTAAVSFTVRNGDAKPCNVAFAFFKQQAPEARAHGGGVLAYQILGPSGGSLVQVAPTPPASLPSGNMGFITVGEKQTVTATATISVAQGQVVGPGHYTDHLSLGIYKSPGGGAYTKAFPEMPFNVTIGVNSQMILSVAGGGRSTTLDFGNFVEGAVRSVNLLAYANQGFHLSVSSDNAGVMKPVNGGKGQVPYTVAIFKTASFDLSQRHSVSLWPKATQSSGLTIPIDVKVGSSKGQPAGTYRDVITFAIEPKW